MAQLLSNSLLSAGTAVYSPMIKSGIATLFFTFAYLLATAQPADSIYFLDRWDGPGIPWNNSGAKYNEVWGFVQNGNEYAVIGSTLGTHILLLDDQNSLTEVAYIPGGFQGQITHRDYHDYKGYLYAVCQQGLGQSALQILDLSGLPNHVEVVYDSDAIFSVAHNIYIDTAVAKMYVCLPDIDYALFVLSLANPVLPTLLYAYDDVPAVHDVFARNDTAFFNAAGEGLYVYNFSNSTRPKLLGSLDFYPEKGYNHSGWLSEDGRTYIFADETVGKRLKVCDVSDLSDIEIVSFFGENDSVSVPHNQMLKDGIAYISYYAVGVEIYDVRIPSEPVRLAGFDPGSEGASPFTGVWGIYAFLPSGRLLISDRQQGLFALAYFPPPNIQSGKPHGVYESPFRDRTTLFFDNPGEVCDLLIYDMNYKLVRRVDGIDREWYYLHRKGLNTGMYLYRLVGTSNGREMIGKFAVVH